MLDPDDLKRVIRLERQVMGLRAALLIALEANQALLRSAGRLDQVDVTQGAIDALKTLVPNRSQNG